MLSPPQEVRLEAVGRAISGAALMIFAGLLSARKKVPRWNIGSTRAWLKGHIWLSLLSVPLIFYHAGFHWGGLIEQLLMLVFVLVVVSGMIGLLLQQYLPRLLKTTVDAEAMFDQNPYLCGRLRETADEEVAAFCGDLVTSAKVEGTFNVGNVALAEVSPLDVLREFHVTRVRPFLTSSIEQTHQLDNTSRAAAVFARVKTVLPEDRPSRFRELVSYWTASKLFVENVGNCRDKPGFTGCCTGGCWSMCPCRSLCWYWESRTSSCRCSTR